MLLNKKKKEFNSIILRIKKGILFCEYKEGKINIEKAKEIVKNRASYTDGIAYPAIISLSNKVEVDKEARAYFKTEESGSGLSAVAMISTSSYSLIIMNFMLRLYTPSKMPIKMFTDEDKAVKWLMPYVEKPNE